MSLLRTAFAALPLSLLPVFPAFALTAEEVWADWTRLAALGDVAITASTQRQGDRLVVTDIAIPVGPPEDQADLMLERIELVDLPDDTVSVVLPPSFPVTFKLRAPDPDFELVTLLASAPDFSLIVSGIGDQAAFDLKAPSLALSLKEIVPALQANEKAEVSLALADLSVEHRMDLVSASKSLSTKVSLGVVHGDALIHDEVADGPIELTVDLAGLAGSLDFFIPATLDEARLGDLDAEQNPLPILLAGLADGFLMRGEARFEGYTVLAKGGDQSQEFTVEYSSEAGSASAWLDKVSAGYELALGKTQSVMQGLPDTGLRTLSLGFDEFDYGLSIGIGDLVSPQEVRFHSQLANLTLPPEIWQLIDPTGAIQGTPMSYAIDVLGRYALAPEMLNPDWEHDPAAFPPVDLVDVTLTELSLNGLGVALAGEGALTFDETDLQTYEGLPAPDGKVTLTATGVNALIDRLVAAGQIPADELTAFRMGLMFIAKAGAEPDSLTSEVEFRDKGFYLNGVKLR
ncbi:MAG: DUF2125 domain-containing protein [Tabrizicola sp.]|jgi:hypothetical protein|nr:DUF2125 domain-containing protein [Tabrizicola sp.]